MRGRGEGHGLTHGTIAGIVIRDLIFKRQNPWADLYDPTCNSVKATLAFARENLNVVSQDADWITPGEVSSFDPISPDEGAIVRHGLKKLALFRDREGTIHPLSASWMHRAVEPQ